MGWFAAGLSLALLFSGANAEASVDSSCDAAAAKAERDWNIPTGTLSAVGRVESGRMGRTGVAPWPWTVNAAGRGTYLDNKGDAVATVLTIMTRGYPYIDVGCFQIDIAYHPGVFRSLDDAFDPEQNAQAAAKILLRERMRSPDWDTAIAHYHSATPSLGSDYLQRVRRALPEALRRLATAWAEPVGPTAVVMPAVFEKLPVVIYLRPLPTSHGEPQLIHLRRVPPRGTSRSTYRPR